MDTYVILAPQDIKTSVVGHIDELRSMRKALKISISELSSRTGLHIRTIYRLERNPLACSSEKLLCYVSGLGGGLKILI